MNESGEPSVPYVKGSETSKDAADRMKPVVESCQTRVLDYITACGLDGATDDEGEVATGLIHQNYSARRVDLWKKGIVVKTEEKRETRRHRGAGVYVARSVLEAAS